MCMIYVEQYRKSQTKMFASWFAYYIQICTNATNTTTTTTTEHRNSGVVAYPSIGFVCLGLKRREGFFSKNSNNLCDAQRTTMSQFCFSF